MKRTLLLSILLPLVILCQSSKSKIQLIEDLDSKYKPLPISDIVAPTIFSEENLGAILGIFNRTFSAYWYEISKTDGILTIRYIFYISQYGKIDRVKRIDNAYSPTPPGLFFRAIEPKLLELFASVKLNPIWGNNFGKYRFAFEYHIGKGRNNKMESAFSFASDNIEDNPNGQNEAPMLVELPTPKISEADKKKNMSGKVFIKVTVDENGRTARTQVIESAGKILDNAAIEAIKLAKFKPGVKNGKAYKMDIIVPIEYNLE